MHILVSNDDGIYAPGLRALAEAMLELGKVTVIAPEQNHSATGHKKTLHNPLRIRPFKDYHNGITAYALDGSPSDCTAVAMLGFVEEPIDLVVSGINAGPNLAQDVTYSGTVAVTLEAAIFGLPAIAFSLDSRAPDADYSHCAEVARGVAQTVIEKGLPRMSVLNVNIPEGAPKGFQITRQGVREYRDALVERIDPHGRKYYWLGGEIPAGDVELEGTDLWAVHHGYVSITPLHLDLTAHQQLNAMREWDFKLATHAAP